MIVDTSIWVDHFRRDEPKLRRLLETGAVLIHPFVAGELACGNLADREEILSLLGGLRPAPMAEHDEVLDLVTRQELYGRGVGWIDVHLLASARLAEDELWTRDRRLATVATELGVGADKS